jgi:hypothetical protein
VWRHVQAPDEGKDARKDNIEASQELLKRDVMKLKELNLS